MEDERKFTIDLQLVVLVLIMSHAWLAWEWTYLTAQFIIFICYFPMLMIVLVSVYYRLLQDKNYDKVGGFTVNPKMFKHLVDMGLAIFVSWYFWIHESYITFVVSMLVPFTTISNFVIKLTKGEGKYQ